MRVLVQRAGKTMLAKAVAHHTTAAFIRVVGSEFVQKYLGEVTLSTMCSAASKQASWNLLLQVALVALMHCSQQKQWSHKGRMPGNAPTDVGECSACPVSDTVADSSSKLLSLQVTALNSLPGCPATE